MSERTHSGWQILRTWAVISLITLVLLAVCGEVLFRTLFRHHVEFPQDERTLAYRYDPDIGWLPRADSSLTFTGSQTIRVAHNHDGFRDPQPGDKTRPRLVVLGDSFVWGYDVEQEERFTECLRARHPDWEVLNLGVSGTSTDQQFLILQQIFDRYQPDVVLLVYNAGDRFDNQTNFAFGRYYKPYVVEQSGELVVAGQPVPRSMAYHLAQGDPWLTRSYLWRALWQVSQRLVHPVRTVPDPTHALLSEMDRYVKERGALFIVGFASAEQQFMAYCRQARLNHVSLFSEHVFPTHGQHWTAEGHQEICERFDAYLAKAGVWQAGPADESAAPPP